MDLAKYRRVSQALAESQRLNALLEQRVSEKQRELERQFVVMQRLSREAAVAEERRRLMADMHDGIGSTLISALSLVEGGEASQGQVAAALRECVDDLRLAIDSLEPTDGDLLPVLGNLRYRLEPRLKAGGITLDWRVDDLPRLAHLTPQNVLHVLRILQEAFANVLKHAGARRIRVTTRAEGEHVLIAIADDGCGIVDAGTAGVGHGLANMRRRARALGGEVRWHDGAPGTTVTLVVPG
jgi:signal transduction histidine kinase